MKTCPTCHSIYPTHFAVCPRDAAPLIEAEGWSEGTVVRGKYRILGKIGQGGMGAVYKALHVKFDQLRALKVMSRDLAADPNFVKRFEREAVLMSKLQHPNVVRVDDIDESEDGCPFIVMEFVEGQSLRQIIQREGPLAPLRVCAIARQAAAGLEAAHLLGMVHRDVKPENIVLLDSSEGERAKVLDFGIAKLKEARAGEGLRTSTGVIIGTPQYLSPEQAMGKRSEELDGRSDLYSLGLVMYQMLTRELPFQADSAVGWMLARLNEPPRPIQLARPDLAIPEGLAALVMRCLEKDRELRPAGTGELIHEIERVEQEIQRSMQAEAPTARVDPASGPRKTCPQCHRFYPDDFAVCSEDGTRLVEFDLWSEGNVIAGRYRLLARLGEDEFCVDFKALQLEPEQFRTLEVVRLVSDYWVKYPGVCRKFAEVFKRSAIERMKLHHLNVARVEAIEESEDGRPFVVMEYAGDRSLDEVMRQRTLLPPLLACAVSKQVAAGLESAHALGMIHGQLNPEAIYLSQDANGEEKIKLVGFGRLKLQELAISDIESDGVALLHYRYMSPEQIMGKDPSEIDGRTDLYSLGLVMYQMLTCELPFQSDSASNWLRANLQDPPRPIRTMRPDLAIPEPLATLVTRCLEKDRELRPVSARELIREIARVEVEIRRPATPVPLPRTTVPAPVPLRAEPVKVTKPSPATAPKATSTSRWAQGRRFWVGLTALVLAPVILWPILDLTPYTSPRESFPAYVVALIALIGGFGWCLVTRRHWAFRLTALLPLGLFALLLSARVYNIYTLNNSPGSFRPTDPSRIYPIAELKQTNRSPIETLPATRGVDQTGQASFKLVLQNISTDALVTDWKADVLYFDDQGKFLSESSPVNRTPVLMEPGKSYPLELTGGDLGKVKTVKMVFKEVDYNVTGTEEKGPWINPHFQEDVEKAKQP